VAIRSPTSTLLLAYGEVQEICFITSRLTVNVIGAQGFSDSGGRWGIGDAFSGSVDIFQPLSYQ
jgi:hypothetical protein